MKRDRGDFFPKNVSEPSNPPDELAQNVSKKIPVGRFIPPFFCNSAESGRFFIYLHDSNSIFWAQGIKSEWVLGRTVWTRSKHPRRQCPIFVSRPGRAVANSYTVHSSAPERRDRYRAVCASCSREVASHAKLRREAFSCHGQFAAPRVTARRRDPIHFALVVWRARTQATWSTPVTSSEYSRSPP